VPQDPNDEPASELLKRIAAERESRTPKKRASSRARSGRRQRDPAGALTDGAPRM
jgi:hypothetical protein